ncbi:hypothetical protein Ancab_030355 [Ancistrocladus abbreviatus]
MNFTAAAFSLLNILIASITVLSTAQTPAPEENGGCADKLRRTTLRPLLRPLAAECTTRSTTPARPLVSVTFSMSLRSLVFLSMSPDSFLSLPFVSERIGRVALLIRFVQTAVAEVDGDDGNVTDVDWKWWLLDLRWILNGLGNGYGRNKEIEENVEILF